MEGFVAGATFARVDLAGTRRGSVANCFTVSVVVDEHDTVLGCLFINIILIYHYKSIILLPIKTCTSGFLILLRTVVFCLFQHSKNVYLVSI